MLLFGVPGSNQAMEYVGALGEDGEHAHRIRSVCCKWLKKKGLQVRRCCPERGQESTRGQVGAFKTRLSNRLLCCYLRLDWAQWNAGITTSFPGSCAEHNTGDDRSVSVTGLVRVESTIAQVRCFFKPVIRRLTLLILICAKILGMPKL